jgi:hypothetical protein
MTEITVRLINAIKACGTIKKITDEWKKGYYILILRKRRGIIINITEIRLSRDACKI